MLFWLFKIKIVYSDSKHIPSCVCTHEIYYGEDCLEYHGRSPAKSFILEVFLVRARSFYFTLIYFENFKFLYKTVCEWNQTNSRTNQIFQQSNVFVLFLSKVFIVQ